MRLPTQILLSLMLTITSASGFGATVFYDNLAEFDTVTSTELVEDFEGDSLTRDRRIGAFTSNGITFTPTNSAPFSPNLVVTSPGYTNFGVALTDSSLLSASGDENFSLTFSDAVFEVGFDSYVNGRAATVSIFGENGLIDTFSVEHNRSEVGFVGITSTDAITSVLWQSVGGRTINTGIDNIRLGNVAATPIPAAAWLFGSFLMGFLGLRKKAN